MIKKLILGVFLLLFSSLNATQPAKAAGVDSYTITNFDITYNLSRDAENHAVLETKEIITANFTNLNTNHGLERGLPYRYNNHPTDLKINSVTDLNGKPYSYTTVNSGDYTVMYIGDPNKYEFGKVTYVINYTNKYVTRYYSDTNADEFYWDTNGVDWRVPINKLNVTLNIDPSLLTELTGKFACYQGYLNINSKCDLFSKTSKGFTASAFNLKPNENLSLSIGFNPNTFVGYKKTLFEKLTVAWLLLNIAGMALMFPVLLISIIIFARMRSRKSELKTIVTEFTPPKDVSITTSAQIINSMGVTFTAQILDLAVRHYIKIYQVKEKSLFSRGEFELEIVKNVLSLKEEEREILSDLFGKTPVIGDRFNLKNLNNNSSISLRFMDNASKLKKLVKDSYGLREKVPEKSKKFRTPGIVILVLGLLLINFPAIISGVFLIVLSFILTPLSDKGLELSRYLEGLKKYIKTAEVERIKMLQSPEGAEKVGNIDANDPKQLIKLYEKVLPYAVLFRLEKSWNKQIGMYYETTGTQPDWYAGSGNAFNAIAFTTALSSFNSVSSTYSSTSGASSGGSGGGGFSGGGGGGGGGGGW